MGDLDGKVAIVTGAGQGVGRGIALALSKEGATVVIAEMNEKTAQNTAQEISSFGGKTLAVACDVRKRDQVDAVVEKTVNTYGTVDILVNNAQATRPEVPFEETTDDDMALALNSGLMGTFYFMQACFPHMKKGGGKIINLGSAAGTEGMRGFTAYAATKEAIRAITRVASKEWGKYKINVNAICPYANSPGMLGWAEAFPESYQASMAAHPLGRIGDCEKDIGRTVVFLSGPDSDYITGQTVMVDGGQSVLR